MPISILPFTFVPTPARARLKSHLHQQPGFCPFRASQAITQTVQSSRTGKSSIVSKAENASQADRLQQYFDRICLPAEDRSRIADGALSVETLSSICVAHAESIPFENLDLVYEPAQNASPDEISLNPDDVFEKLVIKCRGGYCFETNGLLTHALRQVGFDLYTVAARVVLEQRPTNPDEIVMTGLDHQVILVRLGTQRWVCDVGFGGSTPKAPVLLVDPPLPKEDIYKGGLHRVRRGLLASKLRPENVENSSQREGWYMQRYSESRKTWHDLYFFSEHEWRDKDYDIPNFYCSHNHPLFTKQVVVALQLKDGRKTISGTRLRLMDSNGAQEHDISDPLKFEQALKEHFGIRIPTQ